MKKLLVILSVVFLLYQSSANGQCVLPSPVPTTACGVGTQLMNNVNINSGQTYYYSGSNGNFSNISLNGGLLVLCGSATLSNVNHNGGTLLIREGANITFAGSYNVGGSSHYFFNLGSATFQSAVQVQNSNQFVYNGPGASLVVNGQIVFLNNGILINEGTTVANRIVINGSNINLCLGPGAISITESIESNGSGNGLNVPTGTACVSYATQFSGNAPITTSPNLRICQLAGASNPAPNVIGKAILSPNCSSCSVLLPVELIEFTGREENGLTTFAWSTSKEEEASHFVIERSEDGGIFYAIATANAKNVPYSYRHSVPSVDGYFRLKIFDLAGIITYSQIISVKGVGPKPIRVANNPVESNILRIINAERIRTGSEIIVRDYVGKVLIKTKSSPLSMANEIMVDVGTLPKGYYLLQIFDKPSPLTLKFWLR